MFKISLITEVEIKSEINVGRIIYCTPGEKPMGHINRSYVLECFGEDYDSITELADIYFATLPKKISDVKTSLCDKNCEELLRFLHLLRGSVSAFGASDLMNSLKELETNGKTCTFEELDQSFSIVEKELNKMSTEIEDWINEIRQF